MKNMAILIAVVALVSGANPLDNAKQFNRRHNGG